MISITERLIVENLLFFTLATSFLIFAGWLWRHAKPFSLPQPLPNWFQAWLTIVIGLGVLLPLVTMLWAASQGDRIVVLVLISYFVMLCLQILSESLTVNRFQSCVWVTIPCLYLPYRLWQLYSGLILINRENGSWIQGILIFEMVLWTFNYGVHLSQIPWLLRWESSQKELNV
ncbi:hypothetical protein [Gloeocapsopsis sp. IPPAS B-1203]|uniref:hypothetical protein n=1 Tax=Gloeocapsopsis sp. IPPAS B-1203 TaxID=2049454 RepID=UPI000C19C77E|nr:hypothetical protein [Gloeocapsopsis sp. IPPAS B-1203]PIG94168.1 hypothetical protein CSQ79_07520 [Gloeocapsopsis sp. IPPAS B-1203]